VRVLILWSFQTSFIEAAVRELDSRGIEVDIYYIAPNSQYPKYPVSNSKIRRYFLNEVGKKVSKEPEGWDLVFCMGWHILPYLRFLLLNPKLKSVMYMDNQFLGKKKQVFFTHVGKIFVKIFYDAAFVPGNRQVVYAELIGFPPERIYTGGVSYDAEIYYERFNTNRNLGTFVFVGRIAHEKGIEELIDGYKLYRKVSERPVDLVIIGPPEDISLKSEEHILIENYLYPEKIAAYLAKARFFVFPSKLEAWGVALIEAAASGAPLISTRHVGAADHVIRNSNGIIIEEVNPKAICDALLMSDEWNETSVSLASKVSAELAQQYSPVKWADKFLKIFKELSDVG